MAGLPLLILGASARAAAWSAARAGFDPTGVDLFADRDLAARFPAVRVGREAYPAALADVAAELPDSPWIYTGALENRPGLVDRIARSRPLLGIGGEALRAVRDPRLWAAVLRRAGLPVPECRVEGDEPPGTGPWLCKPRASAMGTGIRRWTIGEGPVPPGWFLQAVARGAPKSACFVGDGHSARLVGVTGQFLGRSDEGLRVVYRGSIGPLPLGPEATSAVLRIGEVLADSFGLRGLFGIDLKLDGQIPWPVEINPRYTASVEVLEEVLGVSLLAEHARAFGMRTHVDEVVLNNPPHALPSPTGGEGFLLLPTEIGNPLTWRAGVGCGVDTDRPRVAAKFIINASRPAVVPEDWPWSDPADPHPTVADIPTAGTILRPGDPVLTVIARGPDSARLKRMVRLWQARIGAWPAP
jgi:predicted ATP-grasp superfamily ATP-dependent carboligase